MVRGGSVRMLWSSDPYVQSFHTTSCIPPRSGVTFRYGGGEQEGVGNPRTSDEDDSLGIGL